MSYIEIPVSVKKMFGSKIRPYVMTGLTFGLLLDAEAQTSADHVKGRKEIKTYKADINHLTRPFDIGVQFGAGLNVPFRGVNFVMEGRYSFGFVDLIKDGPFNWESGNEFYAASSDGDDIYNRGIQFSAGVQIPIQ
jgi:hypothetical protein